MPHFPIFGIHLFVINQEMTVCNVFNQIISFQVLYEKDGEHVAQFKFTVLLMPNGPHKITGIPFDIDSVQSDKKVEDLDIQVSQLVPKHF